MKGRATETLFREVCRWQARTTTPDARAFECRTDDDAVLAIGLGGPNWEPATSFRREPVPLASILPEAKYFTPEHYGLPPLAGSHADLEPEAIELSSSFAVCEHGPTRGRSDFRPGSTIPQTDRPGATVGRAECSRW